MANASAVPLGDGVTIASGLRTNLGFLLDCNQATYNLASGSEWHLLYIKAERAKPTEGNLGAWTFALQSKPLSEVVDMFTDEGKAPQIVDKAGNQVRIEVRESPFRPQPYTQADPQAPAASLTSVGQVAGWPILNGQNIRLDYLDNQRWVTLAIEVGVHIYPIACHRIVAGTPAQAEIVQCARSDFHFWPMPTLPIWSQMDNLTNIEAGIFTDIPG